jgi:hypothetical protein
LKTLSKTLVLTSILCLGGCSTDAHKAAPTAAADHSPPVATGTPAPVPVADAGLHGVVAERLDVPSYTYLRIKSSKGEAWAAVPTNSVAVGTEVTILNPTPMQNFQSRTLNRTFATIFFGGGVQAAVATSVPAASTTPVGPGPHLGSSGIQPAPNANLEIKVAKASGTDARTVAEVYEQAKTLKDKTVSVRAKVVKVTDSVMDRNWLHVRDGSGSEATRNNDLVVTTTAQVNVNDEVTLKGVVHTDKNLGSGYVYSVLIEDAAVTK